MDFGKQNVLDVGAMFDVVDTESDVLGGPRKGVNKLLRSRSEVGAADWKLGQIKLPHCDL